MNKVKSNQEFSCTCKECKRTFKGNFMWVLGLPEICDECSKQKSRTYSKKFS